MFILIDNFNPIQYYIVTDVDGLTLFFCNRAEAVLFGKENLQSYLVVCVV